MINAIFCFFAISLLFRSWILPRAFAVWVTVSVLALAQMSQPTLWAVFGILAIQELVYRAQLKFRVSPFLPLAYAAMLIVIHHALKLNVTGFSYMVLGSSLDLWWRLKTPIAFKDRFFNLVSFPKALVGPIASAKDHARKEIPLEPVAKLTLIGIIKGFVLVNLWRQYVPGLQFYEINGVADAAWFGIWNYVHLYLEFSGACDLVAAAFWLYGFDCPLNFQKPYLALTITDFWKRWHVTLGLWIKNFVFIPLGGSRVRTNARLYVNLVLAMFISGAWHGLTFNYLGWGLLQGALLCAERAIGTERFLEKAGRGTQIMAWAITQALVTASWVLFFSR